MSATVAHPLDGGPLVAYVPEPDPPRRHVVNIDGAGGPARFVIWKASTGEVVAEAAARYRLRTGSAPALVTVAGWGS